MNDKSKKMNCPSFKKNTKPTIGVELELQLIDQDSLLLASAAPSLLKNIPNHLSNSIKAEYLRSVVEISTGICSNLNEVKADLLSKYILVNELASQNNLYIALSGTHPTSKWQDQKMTDNVRYSYITDQLQYVVKRLATFGMHVHIGVESGEKVINIFNEILKYIPMILALSANSPFWQGFATGLNSSRLKVMENLPRSGTPQYLKDWAEYKWLVNSLIDSTSIKSFKEIWWDVRPHPELGTLEIRICDCPTDFNKVLGLTALIQSLVVDISNKINKGIIKNNLFYLTFLKQNKWQAIRYGIKDNFIDFKDNKSINSIKFIKRVLDHLKPVSEKLNSISYLNHLYGILEQGTDADIQQKVYDKKSDLLEVVKDLIKRSQNNLKL